MPTARGLTLLELLIALTLCAVLTGTALLGVQRMLADWRLSAAARQGVMDLARARAIVSSPAHRVRFPASAMRYQHERQRPSGTYEPIGPPTELPPDVAIVGSSVGACGITFV